VKIPAGVREGQRIRLAGLGHEGKAGGTPGDLLLKVRLRSPILERIKAWIAQIFRR
jgi:DnaJ-class molecular chaperone